MNYLLDLIILAVISLSAFIGYKKGLIKVAFGLISFILSIAISFSLYKPVSTFIINYTSLDDYIEQSVSERLNSSEISDKEKENIIQNYYNNVKNTSSALIADGISKSIINIGCVILVFIISKIILLFFRFIGDLIGKLPLIKQVNNAGGFLYGVIKGFFIIYILLALISIISPLANINALINMINNSIIANIMYYNNIILILFG